MKKFFKFLAGAASVAALACGAYYFCKKYICKETPDDFDDFDDDLDDYDTTDSSDNASDSREYVSINITSEPEESKESEEKSEDESSEDKNEDEADSIQEP